MSFKINFPELTVHGIHLAHCCSVELVNNEGTVEYLTRIFFPGEDRTPMWFQVDLGHEMQTGDLKFITGIRSDLLEAWFQAYTGMWRWRPVVWFHDEPDEAVPSEETFVFVEEAEQYLNEHMLTQPGVIRGDVEPEQVGTADVGTENGSSNEEIARELCDYFFDRASNGVSLSNGDAMEGAIAILTEMR